MGTKRPMPLLCSEHNTTESRSNEPSTVVAIFEIITYCSSETSITERDGMTWGRAQF